MRRFLASNLLAILSLIAFKNSQRESREGQGPVLTNHHFVRGPVVGSRRPWSQDGNLQQVLRMKKKRFLIKEFYI
jgi:hypothetical protein